MKSDIDETKNLATSLPEKTVELKLLLQDWIAKNYTKKLEPNPKWNGKYLK